MKVLGLVFSLVGNICTFLVFAISLLVMAGGALDGKIEMGLIILFSILIIVLLVIANIGNKIQDDLQEGLKLKYILFRLLSWIPSLISVIVAIAGPFVAFYGFGSENTALIIFGIYMWIAGAVSGTVYLSYNKVHCKYCGCSLKGGDYDYEEVERIFSFNSQKNEGQLTSRIRFGFYCPECGEENIRYKKMKTDAATVERYARGIIGKN